MISKWNVTCTSCPKPLLEVHHAPPAKARKQAQKTQKHAPRPHMRARAHTHTHTYGNHFENLKFVEAFMTCYPLQNMTPVYSVKFKNWGRKVKLGRVKKKKKKKKRTKASYN
jgi:hypothetical protein